MRPRTREVEAAQALADVMHDRDHRSALLWVDHVDVPVTPADQVHFLIWVIDQLAEIVIEADERVPGLPRVGTERVDDVVVR